MKKRIIALILAIFALCTLMLFGCGQQDETPGPVDYRAVAEYVCEANGIPFITEGETFENGTREILLCGKIKYLEKFGTVVITPDDAYFKDYKWPMGEAAGTEDAISFDNRVMFDAEGKLFDYFDIESLDGHHIIIICRDGVLETYPAQITGQRVAIILD